MRKAFKDFQTCGDPVLENMLKHAVEFELKVKRNEPAHWLSFVGGTGTGKTMLSEIIFNAVRNVPHVRSHATLVMGAHKIHWPDFSSRVIKGEGYRFDQIKDANFVVIDEMSVGSDKNGFERDLLWRVIYSRVGKFTVINTNLTMDAIEALNARIASRMVRDGSIVVECNTQDFGLR